jgi:biopolymer transport protein ExbB
MGLIVAIPCAIAYSYLSARVNALLHDMERAGIEVVNLICDHRRSTTIVEFDSANRADASPESAKRS